MNIIVEPRALEWFRREVGVHAGDCVRLFARYGGESNHHPGYSLGICVEPPENVAVQTEQEGICFYIREEDAWYLDGRDLRIAYLPDEDSIAYLI